MRVSQPPSVGRGLAPREHGYRRYRQSVVVYTCCNPYCTRSYPPRLPRPAPLGPPRIHNRCHPRTRLATQVAAPSFKRSEFPLTRTDRSVRVACLLDLCCLELVLPLHLGDVILERLDVFLLAGARILGGKEKDRIHSRIHMFGIDEHPCKASMSTRSAWALRSRYTGAAGCGRAEKGASTGPNRGGNDVSKFR